MSRRIALFSLFSLAALLLLPSLGTAPFERAEIYFMDVARGMVESGDYLVPRYRGELFFDKPPVSYWLMAASFLTFGIEPQSARLVPAVSALLVIAATLWLGRLFFSRRHAMAGAVILTTTVPFLAFGRLAMSDMLLTLSCVTSVALAAEMAKREETHGWRAVALGVVLGLGFMTKGPIALILPGFAVGLLVLGVGPFRLQPRLHVSWLVAALAFAATGLSWFAAIYARLGPAPLGHFFWSENLERFAGQSYDSDRAPWYYVVAYLAEGFPWSVFFVAAVVIAWRERGSESAEAGGLRALLLWLALMALPLTLSRGKLDYYLLPLYPAASLAAAYVFQAQWRAGLRALGRVVLLICAVCLAVAPIALRGVPPEWLPGPAGLRLAGIATSAAALALVGVAWRPTPTRVLVGLAGGVALVFALATALLLPPFRAAQPNRGVVADIERERSHRPDLRVVVCEDPARLARDVLFDLRIPVEERCDLWSPASSRLPYLLLLPDERRGDLMEIPAMRFAGAYDYLPATALTLRGLLIAPQGPATFSMIANFPTQDPESLRRNRDDRRRAIKELRARGGRKRNQR